MRGASALQRTIDQWPNRDLACFIVWEPVILSDLGPPRSWVLARAHDPRAEQFWDPARLVSERWRLATRSSGRTPPDGISPEDGAIVWDFVALFPPGAAWDELPFGAAFSGHPVVDVVDDLSKALSAAPADAASTAAPGDAPQRAGDVPQRTGTAH